MTATPGLNKTALIGAVGARVMRIGQNRISGVIGRLEQQRKLAVRTGERGAKLYDLRHKPGGGTPAA